MQLVELYQTLEDRKNKAEVEKHGPYICDRQFPEPWLGVGYYFWEDNIDTAKSWAKRAKYKYYYIGQSSYDYSCHDFFDLVGNPQDMKMFRGFVDVLKENFPYKNPSVTQVLELVINVLGEDFCNEYKAIRARSEWIDKEYYLQYPTQNTYYNSNPQIQICVRDLSFLKTPFKIIDTGKVL